MENTFKSSVFGGFNRDDVIRYIEKTSLESKQQIEALEKESDDLCRENASLREELAAATTAHDELATAYSTALALQVDLKKQLEAAQAALDTAQRALADTKDALSRTERESAEAREAAARELAAAKQSADFALAELRELSAQELNDAKADAERTLEETRSANAQAREAQRRESAERIAALKETCTQQAAELAVLRAQSEEFARVKAHIAEIELSARERADALEADTRARLQSLIGACSTQCELVITTLGTTCANISAELRRTDATVSQLPAAFNTLRTDLKELHRLENGGQSD